MSARSAQPRRMLRRSTAVAVTCVLAALLAGCAPPATAPPSPTSTAIFASEEEALAAATDVYQQYTAALDAVFASGGAGDEKLAPYVTEAYLVELSKEGVLERNGWHTEGSTSFDTISVDDFSAEESDAIVKLKLCRDVSKVRFLDASGADVTPESRMERFPVLVSFIAVESEPSSLKIAESDSWSGDDFCV